MPDYLEELLGNAEDLLEQVKRLEWGLSGLTPERREAAPEETAPVSGETDDPEERRRRAALEGLWEEKEAGGRGYDPASRRDPSQTRREEQTFRRREREEEIASSLERPGAEEEQFQPEGSFPLLEQLERLERAALPLTSGGTGAGRKTGFDLDLSAPLRTGAAFSGPSGAMEAGWSTGGGLEPNAAPAEEELRWAERADRAFQRDSRRYDGGFYLY